MDSNAERAGQLIERLLNDRALRRHLAADPVTVCALFGLEELGAEIAARGDVPRALDRRESKSSLAGVVAAIAAEVLVLADLTTGGQPHFDASAARAVDAALTARDLRAVGRSPETVASIREVLQHPGLTADAELRDALLESPAGGRVADLLSKLLDRHRLEVRVADRASRGPEVVIASVDGKPVSKSNAAARELLDTLESVPVSKRPTAVGSPWDIRRPGYVTEAAGRPQIRIGFDEDPPPAHPRGRESAVFEQPRERPAGHMAALEDGATTAARYPGDGATRQELADWMAAGARRAGLPPELPIMAALTESRLRNLPGGDRDSVGFFQMRTSVWDRGDYAGYADDPDLQLKWFLDRARSVRAERVAAGERDFGATRAEYGEWVADVEQPEARFRGRYQSHIETAERLVRREAEQPSGEEGVTTDEAPRRAAGVGSRAAALALSFRGTPYVWGGEAPGGFDCSGLTQYVYSRLGFELPRVAEDQFRVGKPVSRSDLVRGDLVFFRDSAGVVHHMGMSLGGDRFVHAPHTGDVVKISSLREPYYQQQFAGGRRLAPAPANVPDPEPEKEPAGAPADSAVFAAVQEPRPSRSETFAGMADARATVAAEDVSGYPGDAASREDIAAWMAERARRAGLPPELPVMAALTESGLRNLSYGDRDSVGFFQMRTSVWDRGEYAGYQSDPELQMKWFIDRAREVRRARVASGDETFGADSSGYGEWIADIERPASQYRGRYQPHIARARVLARSTT